MDEQHAGFFSARAIPIPGKSLAEKVFNVQNIVVDKIDQPVAETGHELRKKFSDENRPHDCRLVGFTKKMSRLLPSGTTFSFSQLDFTKTVSGQPNEVRTAV